MVPSNVEAKESDYYVAEGDLLWDCNPTYDFDYEASQVCTSGRLYSILFSVLA